MKVTNSQHLISNVSDAENTFSIKIERDEVETEKNSKKLQNFFMVFEGWVLFEELILGIYTERQTAWVIQYLVFMIYLNNSRKVDNFFLFKKIYFNRANGKSTSSKNQTLNGHQSVWKNIRPLSQTDSNDDSHYKIIQKFSQKFQISNHRKKEDLDNFLYMYTKSSCQKLKNMILFHFLIKFIRVQQIFKYFIWGYEIFLYNIFIMWYCFLLPNQQKQIQTTQQLLSYPINYLNNPYMEYYNGNQMSYVKNSQNFPMYVSINETNRSQMLDFSLVKNSQETKMNRDVTLNQKESNISRSIKPIFPKKKFIKKQEIKLTNEFHQNRVQRGRNPGRNSTSNIFRVFIKLCSKGKFQINLKEKFKQISQLNSFFISYQYFKLRLKELAPSTSNYINIKQFKKACDGSDEFSKAFRCLFHWFIHSYAITHSLTLKGKHRMMEESIKCFLKTLHEIEGELWKQQAKETVITDEDCQSIVSTD